MVFTPLGNTLNEMFKKNVSLGKQIETSEIIEISKIIFEEVFGLELAREIKPLFLKNRTLTVSCSSSTIAQEIRLNQVEIVEKINKKSGKNEIDRIRYLA
jgi:predicted nucleic acid-binding Zn ribbon protein